MRIIVASPSITTGSTPLPPAASWLSLTTRVARTRSGEQMTIKLKGKVEPYFRDDASAENEAGSAD